MRWFCILLVLLGLMPSLGLSLTWADAPPQEPVPVPAPTELALQRYHSSNILWCVDAAWGMLIPALFLFTGLSARLRTVAQRIGRHWLLVVGIYFLLYAVLNYLLDWPLSYYESYLRPHAYGLSNQTFGKWWVVCSSGCRICSFAKAPGAGGSILACCRCR
jgi:STE24 endopeptidase